MTNHPNRSKKMSLTKSMDEWTGEMLLKQPLPFRSTFMCLTSQTGLPIYYAQVFAGYGPSGTTFPAQPIWQSRIRRDIAPTGWPREAQRAADEACEKLLARRETATIS